MPVLHLLKAHSLSTLLGPKAKNVFFMNVPKTSGLALVSLRWSGVVMTSCPRLLIILIQVLNQFAEA